MPFQTTFSAALMQTRPTWKSEKQFINERLYCEGLPYFQADQTDLHYGMKYVGVDHPEPKIIFNRDGSVHVMWDGEPSHPRVLDYAEKRVQEINPWAGV